MLVKLKDICNIGKENYKESDKWTNFRYLDTSNLIENKIFEITHYKNSAELPSRAKQKLKTNDILYSSVRPNQHHYGYINSNININNLLVSTGFIILRLKKHIDINSKYIYYFLIQDKVTDILQNIAQNSTSAYPSITKEDILNLEIDLPSRETQDKIASILSSIDDQIERNNTMVERLQVMGNTIFSKYYEKELLKPNGIISDICNLPSGYSFKPESYIDNGKYKLITIKNVSDIFVSTDKTDNIETLPNKMKPFCILNIGDILMSLTGNVGRISIVSENNCLLNQRVSILSCKNSDYKIYMYYLLNHKIFQDKMINIARGTSQKNLSPIDVEKLSIFIPNNINMFNNQVNPLFNELIKIDIFNRQLLELKQKMLPLLINGQLQ